MKRPWLLTPPKTEDEIFKFTQFELRFIGCWAPKESNRLLLYTLGIFQILVNAISTVGQYAFVFLNYKKLVVILEVLCPATTMGVTSFKQIVILWQTNELDEIFRTIKKAFKDGEFVLYKIIFNKNLFPLLTEVTSKGIWFRKWIPIRGFYLSIFLTCTTFGTGTSVRIFLNNFFFQLK